MRVKTVTMGRSVAGERVVLDSDDAPRSARLRQDIAITLLCGLGAALVAAVPLLHSPLFFYTDDYQTYFMPAFREIARLIAAGELPFITDRLWQGGAFLSEYQLAVLNPVSLGLCVMIARIEDAAAAAAVFSLVHLGLFAGGVYVLCRALGCRPRHGVLAALIAPTSDWLFYWGASNWVVAAVSMAWLPWALGFLVLVTRHAGWFVPAALAVALFLTSGWPFGLLALAIAVAVASLTTLGSGAGPFAPARLRAYGALLAGGLLAAPAILPLFPYLAFSERPFDAFKWQGDLAALGGIGLPYFVTQWRAFDSMPQVVWMPMVYVAWFIPVLLFNAGWRQMLQNPVERTLLALAASFGLLSMLPYVGHFRWMFRLFLYYDLCLIVLAAVLCTRQKADAAPWRLRPTLAALAYPLLLAVVTVPALWPWYLAATAAVAGLIAASLLARRFGPGAWLALAVASNVAIVLAVNAAYLRGGYPSYPNRWVSPFSLAGAETVDRPVRRLALFSPFGYQDPGAAFWRDLMPGNTPLFANVISINGYSPFTFRSYRDAFCFVHLAAFRCDDVVSRITRPTGFPQQSLLDLMRIEEVVVQDAAVAAAFRATAGGGWAADPTPSGATRFTRRLQGLPDPVSWISPGLAVTTPSASSPRRVSLDLRNEGGAMGRIVLARAWYPGWRATLDGTALNVAAVDGILLSAEIPPGRSGRLSFEYWPANFWPGLWLAAAGLGLMLVMLLRALRRRRG